MNNNAPRLVFAAPKSGSGKTMTVCGIIEALKKRKQNIAVFKCGPDYIDPMFHRKALGVETGNLDTFFTDEDTTRYLLADRAEKADITLIEGVMGYYDGLAGKSEKGSTYEISRVTKSPVILIVDCKGASVSLAAMIKGIIEYRNDSNIKGIILNRVSEGYYDRIKKLIEKECNAEVIGYIPELKNMEVPSRHLGLVSPDEISAFGKWAEMLACEIEKSVNIDRLIEIAGKAENIKGRKPYMPQLKEKVTIAVARDEAFSFYYRENIDVLEKMGAEIVYFSPLKDEKIPENSDGVILWGGYPENFARQLESSVNTRKSIYNGCKKGMPCAAECGGFMYLMDEMEGSDGNTYKMCGVIKGKAFKTERLCRFGYIEACCRKNGLFGDLGERIRGHEFHYWDTDNNGSDFTALKPLTDREYGCIHHGAGIIAGYPHLYYYSNVNMVYSFLKECLYFKNARLSKKHWDMIAKPIDSLGLLEENVVKLCGIYNSPEPPDIKKRALVIMCGDHGVVSEGVTQTGKDVTRIVSENFARGESTVNYMAGFSGTDVYTFDIGMDTPNYPQKELVTGSVIDRKIERGTRNICREAAMSVENCRKAIKTGIDTVRELKEKGYRILATGEMGIGNTTPTSALAAVFLNADAKEVTGKGAGLSKEGINKKCIVVEEAVARVRRKKLTDAVEIMAEIGGYEIAGLAGVFLGGAKYGIPVVIDGAISAVAALCAVNIDQRVKNYILASHKSKEAACSLALEKLGVKAVIDGEMCLGEGTGAVALFPLLDMAINVYGKMGSFEDFNIEAYSRF